MCIMPMHTGNWHLGYIALHQVDNVSLKVFGEILENIPEMETMRSARCSSYIASSANLLFTFMGDSGINLNKPVFEER